VLAPDGAVNALTYEQLFDAMVGPEPFAIDVEVGRMSTEWCGGMHGSVRSA
jgi:hypothetical protein